MARDVASGNSRAGGFRLGLPVDPRPRSDVGLPFRRFNSGWLALDFVNTVPGWLSHPGEGRDWRDRPAGERLVRYDDLLEWSRQQALVGGEAIAALAAEASARPRRAAAVMVRARVLRGSLYRLFRASAQGWATPEEEVALLESEWARLRRHEVLLPASYGAELAWWSARAELEALLWPPVRSALALLTAPELMARVGQCGGPECGWVFLDAGRGRARRWCDSRDCGNVAKARAFRSRRRASG